MRVLLVGDPHIRPDSIGEGQRLVEYIVKTAKEEKVEAIILLGDQFHTHSVIHLSVMAFWKWAFERLVSAAPTYALVGNHDMSGKEGDRAHAMMLYEMPRLTIVDQPTLLGGYGIACCSVCYEPQVSTTCGDVCMNGHGGAPSVEHTVGGMLLVPYCANQADLVGASHTFKTNADILVCHQTFDGSKYENGFYAKDGVDPNLIAQKRVISGHIHAPQVIGKVHYPGSPRWQSVSDANTDRFIQIYDSVKDTFTSYTTEGVCRSIRTFEDRESGPTDFEPHGQNMDVIVDVYGSEAWVKERAEKWSAKSYRVRQFITTQKQLKVRESDGLAQSFTKFMAEHEPKLGTPPERLMEMAQDRISWLKVQE